jgi:hypothetical protein
VERSRPRLGRASLTRVALRRAQVEVTTDKGAPAVSTAVLRSLAGKPGAALKALKEADDAVAAALPDSEPIPDFEEELEAAEDVGAAAADEAGSCGSGAKKQRGNGSNGGGGGADAGRSREELQAEASSKGWGKMYAAMGGGREGLWACAAIEKLCEVRSGGRGKGEGAEAIEGSGFGAMTGALHSPRSADGAAPPRPAGRPLPPSPLPAARSAPSTSSCRRSSCPSRATTSPRPTTACTAASTSTQRRGASARGGPTSRTSRRWRRTATRRGVRGAGRGAGGGRRGSAAWSRPAGPTAWGVAG